MRSSNEKFGESDESDLKVANALSAMPRINAPSNMESVVRSRIKAHGMPRRAAWLLPASVSISAVLLSVVAALYVTVGREGQVDVSLVEPVEPGIHQTTGLDDTPEQTAVPLPVPQNGNTASSNTATNRSIFPQNPDRNSNSSNSRTMPEQNSSVVEAARPQLPPVVRDGVPVTRPDSGNDMQPSMLVSIQNFLRMIGVSAKFEDGGWLVNEVSNASIAQRAGVRSGDVLTAIGSRRLGPQTQLDGTQVEQRIELRRNGRSISVQLNR